MRLAPVLLFALVGAGCGGSGKGSSNSGGAGGNPQWADALAPVDSARSADLRPRDLGGADIVPADAALGMDLGPDSLPAERPPSSDTDSGVSADAPSFQKLNWSKVGPVFNVHYISGAPSGDLWLASASNDVLHIRPDGTSVQWRVSVPAGSDIKGIYAPGAEDAYISTNSNSLYHWDGSGAWKAQGTGISSIGSVGGSGPNDVYASLFHSTGDGTWSIPVSVAGLPVASRQNVASLDAIWVNGPTDVWGATMDLVFRSNGDQTWTRERIGTSYGLSIWAATTGDAYVVTAVEIVRRRPNGKWQIELTPTLVGNETLYSVWGSGPTDVYATGMNRYFRSAGDGQWHEESLPGIGALWVIWGRSSTDVYVGTGGGLYHGQP